MSLVVLLLLVLLGAALPELCPDALGIARHRPDLFIATTIYLALRAPGYRAVGWGIGLGVVVDAISLDPLGTHAFVLGLLAYLFAEGSTSRGRINGLSRSLYVFAGTLLALWIYALRTLPYASTGVGWGIVFDAFPVALWTTLLTALLLPVLDRYRLLDDVCGRRSRALSA